MAGGPGSEMVGVTRSVRTVEATALGDIVRCPICEDTGDPARRQVRSAVYVFCCDQCEPHIRGTFEEERAGRDRRERRDRGPEAA